MALRLQLSLDLPLSTLNIGDDPDNRQFWVLRRLAAAKRRVSCFRVRDVDAFDRPGFLQCYSRVAQL